MPVDRSSMRFYHQLLQEYYSAREMLTRDSTNLIDKWRWPWLEDEMPIWVRPERSYDPLPPPPTTGWEETTILASGLALEHDNQIVRALININPILAGRCIIEGKAKVDKLLRQGVLDSLISTISKPEISLRVRIIAGEVLGYLGDPRLGETIAIPKGNFIMGEHNNLHDLSISDYQIGKYPVTNEEYKRFINAGGYKNKLWWTRAGWEWKMERAFPNHWQDSSFNRPNQPVIGVSWYECVAYCKWLSNEARIQ